MIPPTLTVPVTGATVPVGSATTFTWIYTGHNNPQSAADLRYRVYGTSTWTTLSSIVTTAQTCSIAGGTFTGGEYEWQVRGHTAGGATSAWSGSSIFYGGSAVAAPTITAPASGSTPASSPITVTWTLPGGTTQTAYEVRRCSDSSGTVIYYDSGSVTSAVQSAAVPLDAVASRTDHVQVAFLYAGTWSAWADITIIMGLSPPMPALVTAAADPASASVLVRITNPAPTGGFVAAVSNDLYRMSPDGSQVRIGTQLAPNAFFTDWFPGAGVNTYTVSPYTAAGVVAASTLDHLAVEAASLDLLGALYPTLAAVL